MADEHDEDTPGALSAALYRIFTALARLCLRHGVPYDRVAEVAKRAFIDVAYREFTIPGRKQSASRVALLTGLHRKEIARFRASRAPGDPAASSRIASSARVIAGWRRDRRFLDRRGRPKSLPFEADGASFMALVREYGRGDLPGRAVLDELTRVGAVTELRNGRVRLVAAAYVPVISSAESLAMLGTDVADLIAAIDHNLEVGPESGFFQRKVAYDNIAAESVAAIEGRVRREGQAVLEKLDRVLARQDRDLNASVKGTARKRVMMGVYFFAGDVAEGESED